jgi:hypothetical protein
MFYLIYYNSVGNTALPKTQRQHGLGCFLDSFRPASLVDEGFAVAVGVGVAGSWGLEERLGAGARPEVGRSSGEVGLQGRGRSGGGARVVFGDEYDETVGITFAQRCHLFKTWGTFLVW